MDPDLRLLERCRRGEEGAWEALWSAHGPAMLRAATARLRSASDAEDACQQALARISADGAAALAGFRGESRLSTWLVAVALRAADDLARTEGRHRARLERLDPPEESVPGPLMELCRREDAASILRALPRLPPRDRLLLKLLFWDRLSHERAARILKVAVGSLTTLQNRAIQNLSEFL